LNHKVLFKNKIMNFSLSKPTVSVLILCFLCFILLIIRIKITGLFIGFFLVWNLFLAITPLFFILLAKKTFELFDSKKTIVRFLIYSFMTVWLLFFPNSPYIITDLMHLGHLPKNLLWFDSVGIFVTALTGLSVGLYSIFIFQTLLQKLVGNFKAWIFVILSMILSGFGLYLGRFARFNSWDAFSKPFSLLKQSIEISQTPLAIQASAVFSIVLIGVYLSFYNLISTKNELD